MGFISNWQDSGPGSPRGIHDIGVVFVPAVLGHGHGSESTHGTCQNG